MGLHIFWRKFKESLLGGVPIIAQRKLCVLTTVALALGVDFDSKKLNKMGKL